MPITKDDIGYDILLRLFDKEYGEPISDEELKRGAGAAVLRLEEGECTKEVLQVISKYNIDILVKSDDIKDFINVAKYFTTGQAEMRTHELFSEKEWKQFNNNLPDHDFDFDINILGIGESKRNTFKFSLTNSEDGKKLEIDGDNSYDEGYENILLRSLEVDKFEMSGGKIDFSSIPKTLKSLDVWSTEIFGFDAKKVSNLKKIETFNCMDEQQKVLGMEHFIALFEATKGNSDLKIEDCSYDAEKQQMTVYSKDLKNLSQAQIKGVKKVNICGEEVSFESLQQFVDAEEILIPWNCEVSLAGLEKLSKLKSLRITDAKEVKGVESIKSDTLTELVLSSQTPIEVVDVSNIKNIQKLVLSGSNAQKVMGLDKLTPTKDSLIDLVGMWKLKEIGGLGEYIEKATKDMSIRDCVLKLDNVAYENFMGKKVDGISVNEKYEKMLLNEQKRKNGCSSILINTEFGEVTSKKLLTRTRGTPLQMRTQRKYLEHVFKNECHINDDDLPLVKMRKAYDWITENLHYADGLLGLEQENFKKKFGDNVEHPFGGDYDHYFLASPFFALLNRDDQLKTGNGKIVPAEKYYDDSGHIVKDIKVGDEASGMNNDRMFKKYSVCEGIANLYQQMLNQLGIESHYAAIDWTLFNKHDRIAKKSLGAHALVSAKVGEKYYFFDPTWDLMESHKNGYKYKHFANTKEQMLARHESYQEEAGDDEEVVINICTREGVYEYGDDIQEWLESKGYLSRYSTMQQYDSSAIGVFDSLGIASHGGCCIKVAPFEVSADGEIESVGLRSAPLGADLRIETRSDLKIVSQNNGEKTPLKISSIKLLPDDIDVKKLGKEASKLAIKHKSEAEEVMDDLENCDLRSTVKTLKKIEELGNDVKKDLQKIAKKHPELCGKIRQEYGINLERVAEEAGKIKVMTEEEINDKQAITIDQTPVAEQDKKKDLTSENTIKPKAPIQVKKKTEITTRKNNDIGPTFG